MQISNLLYSLKFFPTYIAYYLHHINLILNKNICNHKLQVYKLVKESQIVDFNIVKWHINNMSTTVFFKKPYSRQNVIRQGVHQGS